MSNINPSTTIDDIKAFPSTEKTRKLALVGHPNVGKSLIFNYLTGKYANVSNFPGTTVELATGLRVISGQKWHITDSPGIFSLQARTDDERVTRDLLLMDPPDVVVQVADAKQLQKSLHLTLEVAEFGLPMVLALNMYDEALDRGISIDVKRLEEILGIPVIPTVAITAEGLVQLKASLLKARPSKIFPRYDAALSGDIEKMEQILTPAIHRSRPWVLGMLGKDESLVHSLNGQLSDDKKSTLKSFLQTAFSRYARPLDSLFFESRQSVVQEISGEVFSRRAPGSRSRMATLGNWLMHPVPGTIAALGALYLMYLFVGVFGAGILVNFFENQLFGHWINPVMIRLVTIALPIQFLRDALVGPYGIITMAFTYAFALIFPIVTSFFLFFGLMEDSGYLPRLAVMLDRLFRLMGLNGRAVLPMVLGLGCDTMATVTTRVLDTKREKLIVSLLLTLAVPCSAQLGAILGIAAGFSKLVIVIWAGVIAGTLISIGWAAGRFLPGSRPPFLIEIPPLRIPTMLNIFRKIRSRLKWYMKEVIPLFVIATFCLFLFDRWHWMKAIENAFSPIVVSWLGLPKEASPAFLIGFFRRDYGAAGFFELARNGLLTTRQGAVSMVVITLFMPCVAHFLVTLKERGVKVTLLISSFVMTYALFAGGVVNAILRWASIS